MAIVTKDRLSQLVDWLFRGTNIMAQLDSILAEAQASREAALQAGLKVDAVLVLVQSLKDQVAAGGGVSPEEIEAVLAVLAETKAVSEGSTSKLSSVLV